MSAGVLGPATLTGFHGKLPVAGDFLTRGLPVGFQAFWDAWAAAHLARRAGWPAGGLRLRLQSGGRVAAGVVLPGTDRVGRRFPLAAFTIAQALPGPAALDPWADAAADLLRLAQDSGQGPDDLHQALQALAPPAGAEAGPPMLIWARDHAPVPCDPGEPEAALAPLFSCSGSSSP